MLGAVDFEVTWPGEPPDEQAMLVLPRLPYKLYHKTFDNPGAMVVDWRGRTAFTHLQLRNGGIPFHYTLHHEKMGALAFFILAGSLPALYWLLRRFGPREFKAIE